MAMTLRLDEELSARLRAESERTGISQQEIVKHTLRQHLSVVPTALDRMIAAGEARPAVRPRTVGRPPWRCDVSVLDLIDREDRV